MEIEEESLPFPCNPLCCTAPCSPDGHRARNLIKQCCNNVFWAIQFLNDLNFIDLENRHTSLTLSHNPSIAVIFYSCSGDNNTSSQCKFRLSSLVLVLTWSWSCHSCCRHQDIGISLRKGSVHELGEIWGTYHPQPSPIDIILPLPLLCLVLQAVLVLLAGKRYIVSVRTIYIVSVLKVFIWGSVVWDQWSWEMHECAWIEIDKKMYHHAPGVYPVISTNPPCAAVPPLPHLQALLAGQWYIMSV